MIYSTRHVQQVFNVSRETVRTWAMEFSDYLSASANPGDGRTRQFSDDDMRVFSLVSELKDKNFLFEDVHAALKTGQRGDMPQDTKAIVEATESRGQIRQLQQQLDRLLDERDSIMAVNQQQSGQIKLLKEQLEERENQIRMLYRQLARLEVKLEDDD